MNRMTTGTVASVPMAMISPQRTSNEVMNSAIPVGIVFIDLDGFKRVNDECGHAGGDEVLGQIAERIKAAVPEPDSAYRIGGDEFVAVVVGPGADDRVAELASRVRDALTGDYEAGGVPVQLSASVGSAWGPSDQIEALLRSADANMYTHKGRDEG